jgi:hypothetical protein
MSMASIVLARAARAGGRFPDDVLPRLSALPDLRIDKDSISRQGYDVIFRAWLKQDDGSEKEVWARVGTREPNGIAPQTLEEKLIKKTNEFRRPEEGAEGGGGHGNNGGNHGNHDGAEPPEGEGDHDSAVPGDFKRGTENVSRIGIDTLVVYGSTRQEVAGVGHISD